MGASRTIPPTARAMCAGCGRFDVALTEVSKDRFRCANCADDHARLRVVSPGGKFVFAAFDPATPGTEGVYMASAAHQDGVERAREALRAEGAAAERERVRPKLEALAAEIERLSAVVPTESETRAAFEAERAKARAAEREAIRLELKSWLIGDVDPADAGLVNGRRIVNEIDRICGPGGLRE